ncbi:MAG: glycerophosphodiester phosphodiesterase, partial [Deltaproteobacteria bacterium]|nr:glycerophosphodiester phosphodiesterase [Deltaproteobacteria bacterium]
AVLALLAERPPRCINVELKAQPYWHYGLEERVVELVRRFGVEARVVLSSFSPLTLWRLRRLAPEIRRAWLVEPRAFFFLHPLFFGKVLGICHLHPFHESTTPQLVERARQAGWGIITWTVNTRAEMARAIALGVDGIITDDPLLAKEMINGA